MLRIVVYKYAGGVVVDVSAPPLPKEHWRFYQTLTGKTDGFE